MKFDRSIITFLSFCLLSSASSAFAGQRSSLDKSPRLQAERKQVIDRAIKLDVFSRVERNGTAMPRAWTGRTFETLDFKAKQNAVGVVYGYYFDGSTASDSVAIIDGKTGKEIGRFDKNGLRLK